MFRKKPMTDLLNGILSNAEMFIYNELDGVENVDFRAVPEEKRNELDKLGIRLLDEFQYVTVPMTVYERNIRTFFSKKPKKQDTLIKIERCEDNRLKTTLKCIRFRCGDSLVVIRLCHRSSTMVYDEVVNQNIQKAISDPGKITAPFMPYLQFVDRFMVSYMESNKYSCEDVHFNDGSCVYNFLLRFVVTYCKKFKLDVINNTDYQFRESECGWRVGVEDWTIVNKSIF